MRNREVSGSPDVDAALKKIAKEKKALGKIHDQLWDMVEPNSFGAKVRSTLHRTAPVVGHILPSVGFLSPIKERLEQSPIEALSGKLRGSVYGVYESMGTLYEARSGRKEAQQELEKRLKEIEEADEDDKHRLVQSLRARLRASSTMDLNLSIDSKTEDLMDEVLAGTPERQRQLEQRTIEEAQQRIRQNKITIEALESAMVGSTLTFDQLIGSYSTVQDFASSMEALNQNSHLISEAVRLNVSSLRVLAGSIEAGILAAEIAVDAYNIGTKLDQARDFNQLREVERRAKALAAKLPQPSTPAPADEKES